jgi:hypothetical protein
MKGEKCGERCGQFKILLKDMLRGIKENYEKPHARQKRFKSSRSR